MVINVYCQHQLKETGKEITHPFERFKVCTFLWKHPVGFGVRKKDVFVFLSTQNTEPAVSH